MPDYYSILQVSPKAEPEVIKLAYKALAKKYHPDRCAEPDREERMQRINEAYEVLGDPSRRADYDRSRSSSSPPKPEPPRPEPVAPPVRPASPPSPAPPMPGTEKASARLAQLLLGSVLLLVGYFGFQALWGLHSQNLAQQKFEQGDYQGCVELVNQSIRSGSRDSANFLLRARCFNLMEQPEQALIDLDNAASLGAAEPAVALERATAFRALGRTEDALAALEGLKGEKIDEVRRSLESQRVLEERRRKSQRGTGPES